MKRYEPALPRLAIAVVSLFVTASTLGALVVLPSKLELDSEALAMIPASNPATVETPGSASVTCVDVVPPESPLPESSALARSARRMPSQG